MKTAVAALMGLAMVAEAATVQRVKTPAGFERRQFNGGKKNNFGQNRGGKNNNNNNNNAGNNQGNNNNNNNQGNNNNNNNGGNNQGASETCLAAAAVQTGSQSTGQNGAVAADGQVNSAVYVKE